jgi:hypothetical protein
LQAWRPALASEEFALAGCMDEAGLVTVGTLLVNSRHVRSGS